MKHEQFIEILENDPGNPVFLEYAESLRSEGRLTEALIVCLSGLSKNFSLHRGRLLLARLFFEQGFYPFAAREISYLARYFPSNTAIQKLHQKLSFAALAADDGSDSVQPQTDIVAEADFDVEDIEGLDEESN